MHGSASLSTGLRGAAMALVGCIALSGCTTAGASPLVVYVTPGPTALAEPEAGEPGEPEPEPGEPGPGEPEPEPGEPEPEPGEPGPGEPEPEPGQPEPAETPAQAPTSPAARCTGTAAHQDFFADAANRLPFKVFCAVLPTNWWLQGADWKLPDGGILKVYYRNSAGAGIFLAEGAVCSPVACLAAGSPVGPVSLGGLNATLWANPPNDYIVVGSVYNPSYFLQGDGVSRDQLVAWAAGLVVVPKS